jgi:hypothetical protein
MTEINQMIREMSLSKQQWNKEFDDLKYNTHKKHTKVEKPQEMSKEEQKEIYNSLK